eukprot:RCo045130
MFGRIFSILVLLCVCVLGTLAQTSAPNPVLISKAWPPGTPKFRVAVLHTGTGRFWAFGRSFVTVFHMFQDYVERIGGLHAASNVTFPDPVGAQLVGYQVEFALVEVGARTLVEMVANVLREGALVSLGAYGIFHAVVAPYGSNLTEAAASVVTTLPLLAPAAAARSVFECATASLATEGACFDPLSTPPRRFGNLFGTFAPAQEYFQLALRTARLKRTQGVGLVYEPGNLFASECVQGVQELSRELRVPLKGAPVAYDGTDSSGLLELSRRGIDTLIGCVYNDTCTKLLTAMKASGTAYSTTALSVCVGQPGLEETVGA